MLLDALNLLLQAPPALRSADTVEFYPGNGVLFTAPHAVPHARHAAPQPRWWYVLRGPGTPMPILSRSARSSSVWSPVAPSATIYWSLCGLRAFACISVRGPHCKQ